MNHRFKRLTAIRSGRGDHITLRYALLYREDSSLGSVSVAEMQRYGDRRDCDHKRRTGAQPSTPDQKTDSSVYGFADITFEFFWHRILLPVHDSTSAVGAIT